MARWLSPAVEGQQLPRHDDLVSRQPLPAAARQMARNYYDVGEEKQEDWQVLPATIVAALTAAPSMSPPPADYFAATIVAAARQMAPDYDWQYLDDVDEEK